MAVAASIVGGESYAARVKRDGAVGHWRLGEASGTVAADAAVVPHPGTYGAGVTVGQAGALATGNTAALFNGTATGIMTVPTFDPLNGLAAVTIEGWVNHNGGAWPAAHEVICSWAGFSYLSAHIGQLRAFLKIGGVIVSTGAGTVVPVAGWHHVAATWASGDVIRVFLDGVQAGVSAVTSGVLNTAPNGNIGSFGGTTQFFNGSLDEIAVYPTALSPQTIAAHYGLRTQIPSGVRVGGTGTPHRRAAVTSTGGARIGSATVVRRGIGRVGTGGVRVGGATIVRRGVTRLGVGGVVVGGTTAVGRRVAIRTVGGVRVGGAAVVVVVVDTSIDSSNIDSALVAKLQADVVLRALLPDGVWVDEAPRGLERFVIVSLIDEQDVAVFGRRAWEDARFLVEARLMSTAVGDARGAAKRIDKILEDGSLTIPGYGLMTMHREARVRLTEVDALDKSIRWQRRGGRYRVMAAVKYLTDER